MELLTVLVADSPVLLDLTDEEAHEVDPTPDASTRARARAGKPCSTVASGAKVKVKERSMRAASVTPAARTPRAAVRKARCRRGRRWSARRPPGGCGRPDSQGGPPEHGRWSACLRRPCLEEDQLHRPRLAQPAQQRAWHTQPAQSRSTTGLRGGGSGAGGTPNGGPAAWWLGAAVRPAPGGRDRLDPLRVLV